LTSFHGIMFESNFLIFSACSWFMAHTVHILFFTWLAVLAIVCNFVVLLEAFAYWFVLWRVTAFQGLLVEDLSLWTLFTIIALLLAFLNHALYITVLRMWHTDITFNCQFTRSACYAFLEGLIITFMAEFAHWGVGVLWFRSWYNWFHTFFGIFVVFI